ncbi:MAG: DUF2461 family protein [Kofleriaceae bacterium]|nr:DUF2461 family protein [Kofleriaceae bacterium]
MRDLPDFDKSRYEEERTHIAAGLREPGLALIENIASAIDPDLRVDRRSSVSPLHRDLRFAKVGTPRYKDHLLLTTWHGRDRKTAPMLWIRIDSKSVGFASGIAFTPKIRDAWRQAIAGASGASFAKQLAALRKTHKTKELEIVGDGLKRVPKPWSDDHVRADLLRFTGFQIRFQESLPAAVGKSTFSGWCEKRLRDILPVHRWLVTELSKEEHS